MKSGSKHSGCTNSWKMVQKQYLLDKLTISAAAAALSDICWDVNETNRLEAMDKSRSVNAKVTNFMAQWRIQRGGGMPP